MQIIILGKNSDDKGTQLEKLTAVILKRLGYINVSTNEIGVGGNEIDVVAEQIQPGLKGNNSREVICECKAYKNPIQISEWLKFLGKIFTKEATGKNVDGYFIALSGANGNVRGHYRDLSNYRKNIHLISGIDLVTLLKDQFHMENADSIIKLIEKVTVKSVINTSICYYEDKLYWLVSFKNDEFAILSSSGEILSSEDSTNLQILIVDNSELNKFVDLEAENKALNRMKLLEKCLFSILLKTGLSMTSEELLKAYSSDFFEKELGQITKEEALNVLIDFNNSDLVTELNLSFQLKVFSSGSNSEDLINMYRFYFREFIILLALGCNNYNKFINRALLDFILIIQGGIKIPFDKKDDCIQFLKWSPSALSWAIQPDPTITTHRFNGEAMSESMNESDISYFIQKLTTLFSADFQNPTLHDHFFKNCGIAEIETEHKLKVKSISELIVHTDFNERIALAKTAEELGDNYLLIRLLDQQPEPWERHPTNTDIQVQVTDTTEAK